MKEQALNKKLAEWAGFYQETVPNPEELWWFTPSKGAIQGLPDFTDSLDACFKWLVPKTITNKVHHIGFGRCSNGWICYLNLEGEEAQVISSHLIGDAENPALALCLAIEELIDGGNSES